MDRVIKKLAFLIIVVLLIIGASGYIIGSLDEMGGEVRLDYYETIFKYKSNIEEKMKSKELVSGQEYKEAYDAISEYAPLIDEYEEDTAYQLFEVYRCIVETRDMEEDRWGKAKEEMKKLDKILFSAGFDK